MIARIFHGVMCLRLVFCRPFFKVCFCISDHPLPFSLLFYIKQPHGAACFKRIRCDFREGLGGRACPARGFPAMLVCHSSAGRTCVLQLGEIYTQFALVDFFLVSLVRVRGIDLRNTASSMLSPPRPGPSSRRSAWTRNFEDVLALLLTQLFAVDIKRLPASGLSRP